jgi:hypothetical protein
MSSDSSSTSEKPRPRIDDQFWFDRSRMMIEASISSRHDAANKLQGLIGWLWTVYAVVTGAKLTLIGIAGVRDTVGFVLAALALIAAYALAVKTQMPSPVQFDPRDPNEIRDVYFEAARRKGWWLLATMVTAMIALITASPSSVYDCTLSISTIDDSTYLIVEADQPRNALLRISTNGQVTEEKVLLLRGTRPHASIAIQPSSHIRKAMLSWRTNDNTEMTVARDIPRQPQ